jgi:hypothetical protein
MTMGDMWVHHHLPILKIRKETMPADQVVLEALAANQGLPPVVNTLFFAEMYNKHDTFALSYIEFSLEVCVEHMVFTFRSMCRYRFR